MITFYFFDTSALIKRYHLEKGTNRVDQIFDSPSNAIAISNIAITETFSAFSQKLQRGEITENALNMAVSQFSTDVLERFIVIDIDNIHIAKSKEIVLTYHLRALDALQLSVASEEFSELGAVFVCSDVSLCRGAENEDFEVLNPEEE